MRTSKPVKRAWVSSSKETLSKRDLDYVDSLEPHSLSLPGFKIFLIPHASIFRRIVWFCIFVFLISLCGYQISERVRFYLQYPVSTAFAVKSRTSIRFPNISLCLFSPHATTKMRSLLAPNYTVDDVYNKLNTSGMTLDELWSYMNENLEDFLINCTFASKSCTHPDYWSQENYVAGRCHILSINEDVPYLGMESSITLKLKELTKDTAKDANMYLTWKLFLYNEYSNKIYGSFIQGLSIYPNTFSRFRYWEEEFQYENTPVKPCVDPSNHSACMQECYEEQFFKDKEKCRLPFTFNDWHYPQCTANQFYSIFNFSILEIFNRIDTSRCNCGRPCLDINYDTKPDIRKDTNAMETTVCITPGRAHVESMYEVRAYTVASLVSDIGGALGLYMGACILTFFEIINLALQVVNQKLFKNNSIAPLTKY